jgi:AcrR family transcriptional regulator
MTRQLLLQAAAEVFGRQGYHGATLDEVAAAAGFTKGAVYSNFKSKEDLLLALLEALHRQEMDEVRALLDASAVPAAERLSDFLVLFPPPGDRMGDHSLYLELCLHARTNPEMRRRLAEFDRTIVASLTALLESERPRQGLEPLASAERTSRIVLALMRGIVLMREIDPEQVDEQLLEAAMGFLAGALTGTPAPAPPGPGTPGGT